MEWLGWLPSRRIARAENAARGQVALLARQHSAVLQVLIQEYDEAMITCGCSRFTRDAVRKRAIESLVRKIEGAKPAEVPAPPLRVVGGADEM